MYSDTVLPWIILLNDVVTLIASGISCFLSAILLLVNCSNKLTVSFSPTMTVYFIYVFISGFITLLHSIYLVALWRSDTVIYNAIILYLTGSASTQFQAGVPIMEFFLCLDRCFTVIFASQYTSYKKAATAFIAAVTMVGVIISYSAMTQVLELIPVSEITSCRIVGCMKTNSALTQSVIQKTCTALLNCFGAVVLDDNAVFLAYLMKRKFTTTAAVKKLNQVVLHILIIAFFLDFIPNSLGAIGLVFYNIKFTSYIGPYSNTLTSINVTICCCLYWKVFMKTLKMKGERTKTTTTAVLSTATNSVWIAN